MCLKASAHTCTWAASGCSCNPGLDHYTGAGARLPLVLFARSDREGKWFTRRHSQWSHEIIEEVTRNLISWWDMPPEKALRRAAELRRHFPEAWVEGFEKLVDVMTNDPEDRHVLATAVRSHSELIVTCNKKHFPETSLAPRGNQLGGTLHFPPRIIGSRPWPVRQQTP